MIRRCTLTFPGNCVGQVFWFDQWILPPHHRAGNRLVTFGGKKRMRTGQEPIEVIESPHQRMKLRLRSQVPFAETSP